MIRKSILAALLIAMGGVLTACVAYETAPPAPTYRSGDRDRDGVPNRVDRDRDGDGVPNRADRRPDDPRRY
jgi:hypothetical protein